MSAHEQPLKIAPAGLRWRMTRRSVLAKTVVCASAAVAGPLLRPGQAAAASKLQKSDAEYKDSPRGSMRCDKCVQFQPPASCKIVNGAISPSGSCDLFAPAPR